MTETESPSSTDLTTTEDQGFSEFEGAGLEKVTAADMMIPRLGIIQKLSPQVSKRESTYIEGAEVGMICDLGTGELFPDGVLFLPVHYTKVWLEWFPRASGKGLASIHHDAAIMDETVPDEKRRPVMTNGNYIAETAQFFGLNLSAGRRRSFLPMTSTQLKKARRWITLATGEKLQRADGSEYTAPLFYRTYTLTTGEERNQQGDWMGWVITRGPALPELQGNWQSIKTEAVDFLESIKKGEAKGDLSTIDPENEASADAPL